MIKITDKEIDEFAKEFKEFVRWKNAPKVSNTTAPSQTGYSYQYSVTIPNITIPNQLSSEGIEQVRRLVYKIETIAGTLIESNALNLGLSLKADVKELKELLGIKEIEEESL